MFRRSGEVLDKLLAEEKFPRTPVKMNSRDSYVQDLSATLLADTRFQQTRAITILFE